MPRTGTLLLAIGLATMMTSAAAAGPHSGGGSGPLPDEVKGGASCLSYGILIRETDLSGGLIGDVTTDFSESSAWTQAVQGPWPAAAEPLAPPGDPQAHADAQQVGVSYANAFLGLTVSSSTVFSRCDVVALFDPNMGLFTQAYGRGGIQDLDISLGGPLLGAEVLDFEINAFGLPWGTGAFEACDVAELDLLGPPPEIAICPTPNTLATAGLGFVSVSVVLNEENPPFLNAAGQWVYTGSAVHVTVFGALTVVDIWIGYVAVAVTGGPAAFPAWIADTDLIPPFCLAGFWAGVASFSGTCFP